LYSLQYTVTTYDSMQDYTQVILNPIIYTIDIIVLEGLRQHAQLKSTEQVILVGCISIIIIITIIISRIVTNSIECQYQL
jgi:hypothetical protein